MALIVEDGTGVAGAESYSSVTTADAYWANRTHMAIYTAWSAATTAQKEGALREASDFLDGTYGEYYWGNRRGDVQGLEWPRGGATGSMPDLPAEIVKATNELAGRAISAVLAPDADRGGMVKSTKVGSVSVEFMDGAQADKTYGVVDGILRPVLNGAQDGAAAWEWR